MIAFTPRIVVTGTLAMSERRFNALIAEARSEALEEWHRTMYGDRFKPGASGFEFAPRAETYNQKKLRKKGHTTPLLYSGRFMRSTAQVIEITASAKRATDWIRVPDYVWYVRGRENHAKRRQEIEQLREADVEAMARMVSDLLAKKLDNAQDRKTLAM